MFVLLAQASWLLLLSAQTNKEDLTAKRNRIEEQLATTTRLINELRKTARLQVLS